MWLTIYAHGYGRLPTPENSEFYDRHVPHRAKFHQERRQGLAANNRKAATALIDEQFSLLEEALGNYQWLAGEKYSLADIAWYPNTRNFANIWLFPEEFSKYSELDETH